jgi:hypothetical protein
MTVSTTGTSVRYTGNSSTTSFPFAFQVLAATDLVVIKTEAATGAETTLVKDTDYSVTLTDGGSGGGSITHPLSGSPLASTHTLLIKRVRARTQSSNFSGVGGYHPESHEETFDHLTMVAQEQQAELDVAIKAPLGDTADLELPAAAERANAVLIFDADGNLTVSTDLAATVSRVLPPAVGHGGEYVAVKEDGTGYETRNPAQARDDIVTDGSLTNGKLASMAQGTLKGRSSAGAGAPEDISVATARTLLDVPTKAGTGATGTWPIGITGAAATATTATNSSQLGGVAAAGYVRLDAISSGLIAATTNGASASLYGEKSGGAGYALHGNVTGGTGTAARLVSTVNAQTISVHANNFAQTAEIEKVVCASGSSTNYSFVGYYSTDGSDRKFHISGTGASASDGAHTTSGADLAEFFESVDGLPIPVGATVIPEGRFVRAATAEDDPRRIIGVVRPKGGYGASLIGNGAPNSWSKKYLTDDYGAPIYQDVEYVSWVERVPVEPPARTALATHAQVLRCYLVDDLPAGVTPPPQAKVFLEAVLDADGTYRSVEVVQWTEVVALPIPKPTYTSVSRTYRVGEVPEGVTIPEDAVYATTQEQAPNPAYDPTLPYEPREKRPEWNVIGLIGQVPITTGQPVNPAWIFQESISAEVGQWIIFIPGWCAA